MAGKKSLMAIESKMRRGPVFGTENEEPKKTPWIGIFLFVFLVAGGAGGWYWWKIQPTGMDVLSGLQEVTDTGQVDVQSGTYQAVFLDNGQTYFGTIEDRAPKEGYIRLASVYYLDFRQNPQDTTLPANELKLVKLGGEVHGPDDYMDINTEHILFTEDLRSDSKVAQAIADYVSKK